MTTEDATLMFPSAYERGFQDGLEAARRESGSAVRGGIQHSPSWIKKQTLAGREYENGKR